MAEPLQLPFGGGLDRTSGASVRSPGSFYDLRNVELFAGKAATRKGLDHVADITGGGVAVSSLYAIKPLRSTRQGAIFIRSVAANTIRMYLVNDAGTTPSLVATVIHTFGALTDNYFQICVSDEINQMLVSAHDHFGVTNRVQTRVYNHATGTVADLTADLNGLGAAPVKFRGVAAYLGYLVGWGYGSATDPDRPEVVRISLPGQPTVFNAEHYFLAGSRGDPVRSCIPLRNELLVMKETEIYAITGYDRSNFGIELRDANFGLAARRLAVAVDGVLYFWSWQGPRRTTGGPSEDLGVPLGRGVPPTGFPVDDQVLGGFAVYSPQTKQVRFHFGSRAYVLHLEDPNNLRWSYHQYGVSLNCGGYLYASDPTSSAQLALFYGRASSGLLQSDVGFQDDGTNYALLAESVPVAPAGPNGEAVFPTVTLSLWHTMAVTLRITPIVDGVDQPFKDVPLSAKGSLTRETFDIDLYQVHSPGGVERTRVNPRGTWFSVRIQSRVGGSSAIATGDLELEHLAVEWEAQRPIRTTI